MAGVIWTQQQADARLVESIESLEKSLASMITEPLKDCEWDAVVSFAYNEGIGRFHESHLLELLNVGAYAADEFMRWIFVKGEPSDGLYNRRKAERALFLGRI